MLSPLPPRIYRHHSPWFTRRATPLVCLLLALFAGPAVEAQTTPAARPGLLTGHLPAWATAENIAGQLPAEQPMASMTLVLARSPLQEAAFDQFLADQQNPASPDFHRWLTPAEIGDRFGLAPQQIDSLTGWLQSEGLHVTFVAPSRIFIGFVGSAGDVARAFQTEFYSYNVDGRQRYSIASDPVVPQSLAPFIQSVRGLHSRAERPQHFARAVQRDGPDLLLSNGATVVTPADFVKVYNLPASLNGSGVTIGIVGESRTDFTDYANFRDLTATSFPNPVEVVPTAFGGVDPGPAFTAPPAGNATIDFQIEATLDVMRAASVAPAAKVLLVVASDASGGIDPPAQYLVNTTPVPAQTIDFSFAECELESNRSGVAYWDTLFKQAAAEGISVMVSSGDAGAAGCDIHGQPPPSAPQPISPNALCSSSYATCVGGTEFADSADPAAWWSASNGVGGLSALGYIPEGAWNEPLADTTQPTVTQVAASGGGVSQFIPTPAWQKGSGVPSARAGRYTPDIAFTAAGHDGYLGCLAAGGAPCGGGYLEIFSGTSAAAPDMAGIVALLDQKLGAPQGNLNPSLYAMAATTPSAFHDVTVASSKLAFCKVTTPSLCNNSAAGVNGLHRGQAGYLIGPGYDQATGWGSLDVSRFIDKFAAVPSAPFIPTLTAPANGATVSSTSVTLRWNSDRGATRYSVQLYTASCGGQAVSAASPGKNTSLALTGLKNKTTYYWRAQAANTIGSSEYSSCFSFTVK